MQVWSLGWEDPLEEGMATHSSTLAWRIPWAEEPGRPWSMGWQRVRHDWTNKPPPTQNDTPGSATAKSAVRSSQESPLLQGDARVPLALQGRALRHRNTASLHRLLPSGRCCQANVAWRAQGLPLLQMQTPLHPELSPVTGEALPQSETEGNDARYDAHCACGCFCD